MINENKRTKFENFTFRFSSKSSLDSTISLKRAVSSLAAFSSRSNASLSRLAILKLSSNSRVFAASAFLASCTSDKHR